MLFGLEDSVALSAGEFADVALGFFEQLCRRRQGDRLAPSVSGFHSESADSFSVGASHKVVAQAQKELALAGIALSADPSGQLFVQASIRQPVCAEQENPAVYCPIGFTARSKANTRP